MESELYAILAPVRRRQDTQRMLRWTARGLLAGAAIAVVVAALRWWLPFGVVAGLLVAAVVLGEVAGLWLGMRRKPGWHAAAAAVDAHYKLQDRTVTALAFLAKTPRSPLEEMQIAEALGRLAQVDPRRVVGSRFRREFLGAAGLIVVAAAVVTWPVPQTTLEPQPGLVAAKPKTAKPSSPSQQPSKAKSPVPKPPPDPAAAERLRTAVQWQRARGTAPLGAARAPAGPALRELASQVVGEAGPSDVDVGAKPQAAPAVVLEGEPLPLRYRQTLRRYFESIRPRE